MDANRQKEIMDKAQALVDAGDLDGAESVLRDAMKEAADAGLKMPVDQLQQIANFVQKAVTTAIQEIIDTAHAMGTNHVPVGFLEAIKNERCSGVQVLWATIDKLNVPLDLGTVPDDISELTEGGN